QWRLGRRQQHTSGFRSASGRRAGRDGPTGWMGQRPRGTNERRPCGQGGCLRPLRNRGNLRGGLRRGRSDLRDGRRVGTAGGRVVVAHDCGLIINPDGLKNQIEGNVIQGISRTLIEEVGFNSKGVTSLLWAATNPSAPPATFYPVVHFNQVPSSIEVVLLDHP